VYASAKTVLTFARFMCLRIVWLHSVFKLYQVTYIASPVNTF